MFDFGFFLKVVISTRYEEKSYTLCLRLCIGANALAGAGSSGERPCGDGKEKSYTLCLRLSIGASELACAGFSDEGL